MRGTVLGLGVFVALAGSASAQQPLPRRSVVALPSIGVDPKSGAEMFGSIRGVSVAPFDTLIYVLDYADKNVKVVTRSGIPVRTLGRQGSGPGELRSPLIVRAYPNAIEVVDAYHGHIRFSPTGRALGATRELPPSSYRLAGGVTLQREREAERLEQVTFLYAIAAALRTGRRDTIALIGSGRVRCRDDGGRTQSLGTPFGPYGAFGVFHDSVVVVVDGRTGRVDWYQPSAAGLRHINRYTLPVTPSRIAASELAAATRAIATSYFTGSINSDGGERGRTTTPTNVGVIESPPSVWSVANQIVMANDGTAWIGARRKITTRVGRSYESQISHNDWFVVGREGPRFVVSLPASFALQAVMGDLLIGTDSDGGDAELQMLRLRR